MFHRGPPALAAVTALLLATPARAEGSGPGMGPPAAATAAPAPAPDRIHLARKGMALAQRRSRLALGGFRLVSGKAISRVAAAREAFGRCRQQDPSTCRVQRERLEAVIVDANEAVRDGATEYREALVPLVAHYRRELGDNVVGDRHAFLRIQRESRATGSDRLGDLVLTLEKLRDMIAAADDIIRRKARFEIHRQERVLRRLQEMQDQLERPIAIDEAIHSEGGIS